MLNTRFPHTCKIERAQAFDPFTEEVVQSMSENDETQSGNTTIYEGECRSYRSDIRNGEVLKTECVLAIPRTLQEWTTYIPMANDIVTITMGSYVETGVVLDTKINNFGTDVVWFYEKV